VKDTDLALATLGITQAITLYSAFLPDLADVRRGDIRGVREGEYAAGGITVLIGLLGSAVSKTPIPFLASIIIGGALVLAYEQAVRSSQTAPLNPPPEGKS
jgi:hypothetical protein